VARPRTRTLVGSSPPVNEIGQLYQGGQTIDILSGRTAPWSSFRDEHEYVEELRWPNSVWTYDMMRSDSQLAGLWTAVMYGISQLRFVIDPNGADDNAVRMVSEDLNLPIKGEENQARRRMKRRFAHSKHLTSAFLALIYGHMYFEQVGEIVDGLWRLRKLAPRMPHDIGDIKVADDGGLVSVVQNFTNKQLQGLTYSNMSGPEIPVDRLTAFIFQQEGASWVGRSLLRDCYKNWLVKDRLVRIDAINHARAGGVPYASAAPGATASEIEELNVMMQQFKIGETSGAGLPAGAEVKIAKGTGSDVVASWRAHDEAMARRFLLMVTSLAQGGTSIGSYALGEVFQDFFTIGQKAIAQWYCDVMNEHVIEDWVDWNLGEDEELAPVLTWEGEDEALGVDALATLVKNKIVIVDEEIEDSIRYKYHLPKRTEPRPTLTVLPGGGDAGGQEPGAAPSPSASPAEPQDDGAA
jgi:hypothetical protein